MTERPNDATGWPIYEGAQVIVQPGDTRIKPYKGTVLEIAPGPVLVIDTDRGRRHTYPRQVRVQYRAGTKPVPKPAAKVEGEPYKNPFKPDGSER